MISYLKGDATQPIGGGPKLILHCCNNEGRWGRGFVVALSKRWKAPESEYRAWYRLGHHPFSTGPFGLGHVQYVDVERSISVANIIGQNGIKRSKNPTPIHYPSLSKGFKRVAVYAKEFECSLHMPKLGCGLAGGNWDIVEELITESFSHLDCYVYTL